MPDSSSSKLSPRQLLELYPTRETKIARIREIEKKLVKMESEDEENDPTIIEGHIRFQRGFRSGCGVLLLCVAAMFERVYRLPNTGPATRVFAVLFAFVAAIMILRGILYRPDPKLIHDAYQPHRGTPEYRDLLHQLDVLARALSQDLQAEDEA